jgi:alkylation response protein AidB-like acyl-CoA dehydrogenase
MTDTIVDIDQFREDARAWITANLEPRRPKSARELGGDKTHEQVATARALQRRLFEAGYAGLSFPAEYGGRGLTAAHERAFREEAADYVTPDLGAAGGVTFGPIARSLLGHASPSFLEQHIPKILSGEEIWCQFYSEPDAGSE